MALLGPYVESQGDWRDPASVAQLLRESPVLQCPTHPLLGEIPGGFVVNAFKFESEPQWDPDGPLRLVKVRDAPNVVWLAEAADLFALERQGVNYIFFPEYRDAYKPEHLPRRRIERISDDRHDGRANLLFFDSSVRPVIRGGLELSMFDDGVTSRATEDVLY